MGRTVIPYSQVIEREREAWAKFRRALRREDQCVFDDLFDVAKLHVQAGVYASRPWPMEPILMAILLEQQKALRRLERRVAELEAAGRGE